jgi:hypothetical protein
METQHHTVSTNRALRVFGAPTLLAVASGAGLVSALVGDGVWDMLSWLALGAPLAVIVWSCGRAAGFGRRPRGAALG